MLPSVPGADSMTTEPDRYQNRPLLRLLDCYILDVIGELPARQQEILRTLEPKLQETFGTPGDWREIVAAQMGFLPSVPLSIEALWTAFQQDEQRLGREASASDFVRQFVAQNFPDLDDDSPPE